MKDERHLAGFTFLNEGALMKKGLFITVSTCFALVLGSASTIHAQTTYPVNGVAGFETGLQKIATVDSISDPTLDWGDGTSTVCPAIGEAPDSCALAFGGPIGTDVYGTHRYALPGTYTITVSYVPFPFISKTVTTTATISPPGDFVILSIGDSIASGEGNPVIPADKSNQPNWGWWDDPYSDYGVSPFPADEAAEWPNQAFPCHRSAYAGPAQAAGQLTATNPGSGITFIHYACSGAAIEPGDTNATWIEDAVGQLKVARARLAQFGVGIDILLISAGANSLYGPTTFGHGFGGLASYCLTKGGCSSNNALHNEVSNSFSEFPTFYKNLAMEINCQQPPPFIGATGVTQDPGPGCKDPQKQVPKLVLITEYMDPTRDQNGNFPEHPKLTCGPAFLKMVQGDFEYLYNFVVVPLNNKVDSFPAYALEAGLTVPTYAVTGIEGDFRDHGVCAGSQRWVNNGNDSINLLGVGPPPDPPPNGSYSGQFNCGLANLFGSLSCDSEPLNGTLHPNSGVLTNTLPLLGDFIPRPSCSPFCGQEDYRDRIFDATVKYNPPITTPSATTDGRPYAFGTWTTHNVTVTLSATNAISQSGVGATLYGVDNANCSSANPAGCLTYGGPFMITTSGRHTVTFFSQNGQGFPEAAQSEQVWVDNEPPVMTCKATPSVLWPPNNKMVPVALDVRAVSAAFGPTPFSLKSVTTTESNAASDIAGFVIGKPSVAGFLRASRPGNAKAGESYTFVYQSSDPLGLTGTCTATVTVPHDQRKSNP